MLKWFGDRILTSVKYPSGVVHLVISLPEI